MARPLPAIRGRADPRSDPRFKRVADKLDDDGRKLKKHPPAKKKAAEPEKAAKGPPDEKAGGARARHVDKLDQAETPKPETQSFLSILQAEIGKAMPKTLGETEDFMKGGKSEELKGSLKGNVDQQKQEATGDLKQTSNQPPNEAGIQAKPVTPIPPEPGPAAPRVDAPGAMPAPRPQSEITLEASKEDVAETMKKDKLSDERLKKANDPRFSAVLTTRDAVNKQADAGPGKYRAVESSTLAGAASKAMGVAKKGVSMLLGVKGGSKKKVLSRQEQQKLKEEQELQTFTTFVKKTFDDTKKAVDDRLAKLETTVNDLFDRGTDAALASMKQFVEDKLHRYKVDRYLNRLGGSLLWIRDQFLDLPDEVNVFYEQGRQKFERDMNALAERVANLVEGELAAAKSDVKRAQGTIAAAQKALSPAVQQRAARAAAEYTEKFAELQQGIEDKKQQLAEGLAQKYKEAFDKANETIKAIQDDNKGLVTKAKEAIGEVIRALREFKNRIMGILRKAADTIDLILDDPIGFLGNLLSAIKQGFSQFVANIWTHLKAGFLKWLFGSLASAGVQIPSDLTLPSILKLVLGVLGITYDRMRAKAVKLIGERAVAAIEKVVEYIQILIQGGPAALWEKVKEDLSDLKAMVIDAIQDWIITTVIKKAIAKIASMFNPVGAIIQAVLMIVDVVVFVVTKANQILDFVEAVVDSIANIARGAIGAAANWIEKALANMVPILIGFLASLIGLGGITEKIKSIIKKVQAKVDKAIDKAIKKIVDVVKKLFGKLTGKDKKDKRTEAEVQRDLNAAVRDATVLVNDESKDKEAIERGLPAIKSRYKLTEIVVVETEEGEDEVADLVRATINPTLPTPTKKRIRKHKSKYVTRQGRKYLLKPEYSSKEFIRDTFYGKSYRPAVYNWRDGLVNKLRSAGGLRHPTDPTKYWWKFKYWSKAILRESPTVDHKTQPVVDHWEATGRKTDQDTRKNYFNDTSGCEVVPYGENSSMGAKLKGSYNKQVTRTFRGPGDPT